MQLSKAWNTRRYYTEAGQRFGAVRISEGLLAFNDIDRMIFGVVETPNDPKDVTELRTEVLKAYDNNKWRYPKGEEEAAAVKLAGQLARDVPSMKTGWPQWFEDLKDEDLALFDGQATAVIVDEAFDRLCHVKGTLVDIPSDKWTTWGIEIWNCGVDVGIHCTLTPKVHEYAKTRPAVDPTTRFAELSEEDLALFGSEATAVVSYDAFRRLCRVKGTLVEDNTAKEPACESPSYGENVTEGDEEIGVRCTLTPLAHEYAKNKLQASGLRR